MKVVLAKTQAPKVYYTSHDLTRTRIDHCVAVRVSSSPPVSPVDQVVADILRINIIRQHHYPEGIDETSFLECIIPPTCAFDQSRTYRLWRARIDIVDDRLDSCRALCVRIGLLKPMPGSEPNTGVCIDRGRVVINSRSVDPYPCICDTGLVTIVRELDERMVLTQSDCSTRCCDPIHELPRVTACESQNRLDFGIFGKRAGSRQMDSASRGVEREITFTSSCNLIDHTASITQKELGCIHEHTLTGFSYHLETPMDRRCKCITNGLGFTQVLALRDEPVVWFHK